MSIVTQFYVSMIPERFLNGSSVMVQRVEVHISQKAINQQFATPDVLVNNNIGTDMIADIDQHLNRFATVLRMDGREEWNQMVHLYQRDLRVDAAFWNIFISYSLRSTQHRTELFFEPVWLLHRLRDGYSSGCRIEGASAYYIGLDSVEQVETRSGITYDRAVWRAATSL
ncbi:hypothetical protein Ddye_024436 [Dipteronia dyeriana]|uniref:Uncharacterized protein n=1 Tax=Dipteronia dyeriana TaxID=168575 RepID=A0AAD9TVG8_9ROSI|nr:hypothetical protein Ddye_024436 [Dipteronia dyeriana]